MFKSSGKKPADTKRIILIVFCALALLEGLAACAWLWLMKFDTGRGKTLDYSSLRLVLTGLMILGMIFLAVLLMLLIRRGGASTRRLDWLERWLLGGRLSLFFIQGALIILAIFLAEAFLMSYMVVPVPARPALAWASLAVLETWLAFRILHAGEYRKRPNILARIQEKWQSWLPIQRKTILVLALMGLVYFIGFMPSNFMLDTEGHFYTHADEYIIYPDVVRTLVWQGRFSDVVHLVIEQWPWWYGYPYLVLSDAVLVIPRLVFGAHFSDAVQWNIFLLRQLISVLPMVLCMLLIIYMVNRFKSLGQSVGLFVFLGLIPGVVKFNYRFWHPDAIIVLLILLTMYFLEKDGLRFGRYYYLAAAACGLTVAIKLWGLFFVLAIAGYLLAGLIKKRLSLGRAVLAGMGFILVMAGTLLISSPGLMAPYLARGAVGSWTQQQESILHGYGEVDTTNVYGTGLANWLRFFGFYFMKPFFFFFSALALAAGSLWGSRKTLNRLILAWSAACGFYLITYSAMKNFQYMMPLMMPMFLGAFLLPQLAEGDTPAWLHQPWVKKALWGILTLALAVQFIINLDSVIHSPMMGY